MTCIVGYTDGLGGVWIGGDSAGVSGLSITTRVDKKVFQRGEFLIGFTTSFRMGQALQYRLNVPTIAEGMEHHEYMATVFIDAVRDCLKAAGFASRENDTESGGTFLVGYRGTLYNIASDYQVGVAADGFDAVGCGDEYASGALFGAAERMTPHECVEHALKTAEHFSAGVRGPFTIMHL